MAKAHDKKAKSRKAEVPPQKEKAAEKSAKTEKFEAAEKAEREEKIERAERAERAEQRIELDVTPAAAREETIPSRSSKLLEANKIISEDIKAEIYQISEVVLDEKVREFSKRIGELELSRAQSLQSISEMREELSELRSLIAKQRIGSVEQLTKINEQLNSLTGNVNAMEKVVVSSLDGLSRSVSERKK